MATFLPFDEKLESWDSFKERLQHYFVAQDIFIDEYDKMKAILLNSVGQVNYERVRSICFPSSPTDKSYDELLVIFSKLFTPSIVVFEERKRFYEARKYKTEQATHWCERIRRLAFHCNFGLKFEELVRDKFVTAFDIDSIVFIELEKEGGNIALDIAKRYDAIERPKSNPKNHGLKPNQASHGAKPKKFNTPVEKSN